VYQQTRLYIQHLNEQIKNASPDVQKRMKSHKRHISWFLSRLHRHSHFIQKLESEPESQRQNVHPAFDTIRQTSNPIYVDAIKKAQTWIPYIDAFLRCLKYTWWLHFRGRACLVSFVANTLLEPRQWFADFLASRFVDYEPWIHYSQFQMQTWTAWINIIRMYNPLKQSLEKDPQAKFIDQWLPELSKLPILYKHKPRLLSPLEALEYWFELWRDYPRPLVDIETKNRTSKDVIYWVKKNPEYKKNALKIFLKHWSRRNNIIVKTHKQKNKENEKKKLPEQIWLFG